MTQINLDGLELPQASFDRYSCYEDPLSRNVTMVSGLEVVEAIGKAHKIWRVRWSCDCIDEPMRRSILEKLRTVGPIIATVLPDDGRGLVSAAFLVDSVTQPTFLIDDNGEAVWHNLGFSLREERPH